MSTLPPEILEAAQTQREVSLTTTGRKSGRSRRVTIWTAADGGHLYVRSGRGMVRDWPQNLASRGEADLRVGGNTVKVRPRHVTEPGEARRVSQLYRAKYGSNVRPSQTSEPLTPGEQATFELLPAE